jgi:hypothetical protein
MEPTQLEPVTRLSYDPLSQLCPDEARKIRCGERHFQGALGVDYRVVTSADKIL